jgi:tryptophan-rich sensory protein
LWARIVICVLGVEALGIASGWLTAASIPTWYATLERPPGNPPNWVFGPVWTVLYAMIGTAWALICHQRKEVPGRSPALAWFAGQLALNLAWTPVFFGAHRLGAALVVIVALLVAIGVTIFKFRRLDRLAALLLVPYFCWVAYASYLNAGYFVLNR